MLRGQSPRDPSIRQVGVRRGQPARVQPLPRRGRPPVGVLQPPPVGLGTRSDEFNKAYQDSFARILLRNEEIQTVLNDEGAQLQKLLSDQKAPCWPPDPVSSGTCQIK